MKPKMWIRIVDLLMLFGVGQPYVKDSATVKRAIILEEYFKNHCRLHNSYPEIEKVHDRFPELYPNREWYYWPNESLTVATFQYPMTLPLSSAPGSSKISEFFPIIYSYAVYHPCKGLIRETSP